MHVTTSMTSNTLKIEKIQKKALRYITRDFTSSYSNLKKCMQEIIYLRTRTILGTVL